MKLIYRHESLLVESRFLWGSLFILLITGGLLFRLWYIQIYQGEYYRRISERNRVRRTEISAPRGIMYDRFGDVVLGNRPFFDLVYIPQYVKDRDATFKVLSRLLHIPVSVFAKRLRQVRGRPKFLPISLKRNLSLHEVSTIENNKIFLPGIEIRVASRRDYKPNTPPHMVGYLREIDRPTLNKYNKEDKKNPYLPGDLVGKQGLEYRWESYLRGKRGYRLIQVDAFGRQSHAFEENGWKLPVVLATPGSDLELTIDLKLQYEVKKAFAGKYGAVVVLNPQTGEILAQVSEPGFDPVKMQTGLSTEEWRSLTSNPFKPFLDKTTGGEFPPGSIYKALVALAALEEGIITEKTTHNCPGYFVLGNKVFLCHNHAGHGKVDLRKALMKSCDVYFYQIGVELGVDRIAKYARAFGLGQKLGIKLNTERPGLIPDSAWKLSVHRAHWTAGDTPNISIGQGYNLLTPMQMASFYASIANGGKVFSPYLVKKITNHIGQTVYTQDPVLLKEIKMVKPKNLRLVRKYLQDVVMHSEGTGHKALVDGVTVAGKTGSVQVVGLDKNKNQDDVSMKWKEHALFVAFSPTENAEIAVAVVSENDKIGGGGRAAAPIAQKIIKAYWDLKEYRSGKKQKLVKSKKKEEVIEKHQ